VQLSETLETREIYISLSPLFLGIVFLTLEHSAQYFYDDGAWLFHGFFSEHTLPRVANFFKWKIF
jgi:hypothetical protein